MSLDLHQPITSSRFGAEGFGDRCVFTVDAASDGLWYVSSRDHCVGGVFNSRKAAVHFARDEGAALPHAVVVTHEGDLTTHEEVLDHGRIAATMHRERPAAHRQG
jgi:hypothetical protein